MKRFRDFCLVMLIALLLFPAYTFAQEQAPAAANEKPHFWWGPKVGLNLATATIDKNAIKSQFDSNSQFGIFFQFGRILYLQPEFYYAMYKEQPTTGVATKVNSLKVPVLVGLRLINLGIVSAHVMAGPQGTFFLSESNPLTGVTRQKSSYNFQLGAGADILGFITVDLRYSFGLDNSLGTQIQGLDLKSAINATVGLKFR
jgi:hypothetical protein